MNVRLETGRLVLRVPHVDDVDEVVDFVRDEETMRALGSERGDRAAAVEHVARWIERWEQNGIGQFAVLLDGRVIGRVGFIVWDATTWQTSAYETAGEDAETELGWALSSSHWGRGYATEAARAARDWARDERGLTRLISLIDPGNVRSARVAEKLGARTERRVETAQGPTDMWVHP